MEERQICSKDAPMPAEAPGRWQHPEAREIGETYSDGCFAEYQCPHCKRQWTVELPD